MSSINTGAVGGKRINPKPPKKKKSWFGALRDKVQDVRDDVCDGLMSGVFAWLISLDIWVLYGLVWGVITGLFLLMAFLVVIVKRRKWVYGEDFRSITFKTVEDEDCSLLFLVMYSLLVLGVYGLWFFSIPAPSSNLPRIFYCLLWARDILGLFAVVFSYVIPAEWSELLLLKVIGRKIRDE